MVTEATPKWHINSLSKFTTTLFEYINEWSLYDVSSFILCLVTDFMTSIMRTMGHFLECIEFVCNGNTDFMKKILDLDFSGLLTSFVVQLFDHAGSIIGYITFIMTQLVYRMFEFVVHKVCPVTTGVVNFVGKPVLFGAKFYT